MASAAQLASSDVIRKGMKRPSHSTRNPLYPAQRGAGSVGWGIRPLGFQCWASHSLNMCCWASYLPYASGSSCLKWKIRASKHPARSRWLINESNNRHILPEHFNPQRVRPSVIAHQRQCRPVKSAWILDSDKAGSVGRLRAISSTYIKGDKILSFKSWWTIKKVT